MFLRMVARPLMAKVKQTTGIKKVPDEVVPNLREVLTGLYSQILNQIKKLPDLPFRQNVELETNYKLKYLQEREDIESTFVRSGKAEAIIEEARRELSEISGLVEEWQSFLDEPMSEREQLILLYYEALDVVRKVPENNKLRMFAESSITHKLKICQEEGNWESIKSKFVYEDPIQKAREELDHWSLFFGKDACPNQQYPLVSRTKDFCERFDAWRELACSTDQS